VALTVVLFAILAILGVASAVVTVASKHPVRSAMALVVHFFMLAGLYLTLSAQFLAVLQILVYAGAIMVLVIFVIMLLNLGDEEKLKEKLLSRQALGIALSVGLAVLLITMFVTNISIKPFNDEIAQKAAIIGTAQNLGKELYTKYIIPIEAIAILLTLAIVGAIVLAKRKLN
jgi:NADH-quinone oxidoreductase subunit J